MPSASKGSRSRLRRDLSLEIDDTGGEDGPRNGPLPNSRVTDDQPRRAQAWPQVLAMGSPRPRVDWPGRRRVDARPAIAQTLAAIRRPEHFLR
jgi:hypothetical protein